MQTTSNHMQKRELKACFLNWVRASRNFFRSARSPLEIEDVLIRADPNSTTGEAPEGGLRLTVRYRKIKKGP